MAAPDRHDPVAFSDLIGLRYIDLDEPGITRLVRGTGFSYRDTEGRTLTGLERERCQVLAIPPAWGEVWICATEDGHVQARGVDEAERTQYRYHDRWTQGRRLLNFDRFADIGARLGAIRKRLEQMLADDSDPTRQALAAMVRLVDTGLARIGGSRSARQFGHFGVSTLRSEHVAVDGDTVSLTYPGKSGVDREITLDNALLADVIAELDASSERIFVVGGPEGERRLHASDANALLDEMTRTPVTCKDFRTWGGSAVALEARIGGASEVEAVDAAAERLGNTRAVARGSYVHPDVTNAPMEELEDAWRASRSSTLYDRRESALLKLLQSRPPLLDQWTGHTT